MEAVAAFRRSLALAPGDAQVHVNLGAALHAAGRSDEAIAAYQQAIAIKDDDPRAYNNLGMTLQEMGRLDEATAALGRAIALAPNLAEAHNNLGNALKQAGRYDEAIAALSRAIALAPNLAEAHNNLGGAFWVTGRLDESLACFRRALALKPDYAAAASTVLVILYFHPDYDAQAILAEHRRWDAQFAAPLAHSIPPHRNDPSPDRRLRIGYVSPDWPSPPARFILPLLKSHDRTKFEIFFYSLSSVPAAPAGGCRAWADAWRETHGHSDLEVTETIRQDRIDILVDLYMHSDSNRMRVFARKSAPVQVTYLAYCGTTGLRAMDYRLTDPFLDPTPATDRRLQRALGPPAALLLVLRAQGRNAARWCAAGPEKRLRHLGLPEYLFEDQPAALAALGQDSFKPFPARDWFLHPHPGTHRESVLAVLQEDGIAPDRVAFVAYAPFREYIARYHDLDLCLDPFPYGGGTTTLRRALTWMGVPVVTPGGPYRSGPWRCELDVEHRYARADCPDSPRSTYGSRWISPPTSPRLAHLGATPTGSG